MLLAQEWVVHETAVKIGISVLHFRSPNNYQYSIEGQNFHQIVAPVISTCNYFWEIACFLLEDYCQCWLLLVLCPDASAPEVVKIWSPSFFFGDGPNTVSESTVSNTELSEFFARPSSGRELSEFLSTYSLCANANSQGSRRTHRVCPQTQ